MKKLVLFLSVVALTTSSTFAQKVNVESLKAKIAKSDETIANPKKNGKASTWLGRGELFNSVVLANSNSIFVGMLETMMLEAIGKPTNLESIPVEVIGGKELKKFEYPTVDIYLTNEAAGSVVLWIEKSTVDEEASDKAVEAFLKAYEIDKSVVEKAGQGITELVNYYSINGQNLYDLGNFSEAYKNFEKGGKIGAVNPKGENENADALLYYAVVAATQAEEFATAADMIEGLIEKEIEQGGDIYLYAGIVFEKLDKKDIAKKYMEQGIKKYLDNQRLLQQFITFSLQNNAGAEDVMPYITEAQAKDPKNAIYVIAEGIVYNQAKDYDKAITAYEKAVELDPTNFGTYYNLGFAYRAKAIDINTELGTVDYTNTKLIDQLRDEFFVAMSSAIAPFEKAHELQPEDKQVVEVLKSIFFTLRDQSQEMMDNYTKYDELFKSM